MENINETRVASETVENATGSNYLDDIIKKQKELETNFVAKDEYERVIADNKKLADTLLNGGVFETKVEKEPVDIQALRNELFNRECELSNLEYITKSLELRDALIEKGEPDPFLPVSSRYTPSLDEIQRAENAAEVFKECVEYANGNSEIFTQELMRRTTDAMPMRGNRK